MLSALGVKPGISNHNVGVLRYFYRNPVGSFGINEPLNGGAATYGNGSTVGLRMESPQDHMLYVRKRSKPYVFHRCLGFGEVSWRLALCSRW